MVIKKTVNKKVSALDFYMDITKNNLLSYLCTICHLEELFIEIYSVEKNKISIFEKLLKMGFNIVNIPYKNGVQDVAIKINKNEIPILLTTLLEYDFEEMTVWDANERWEQHLYLAHVYKNIYIVNEHNLYICYNHWEKKVELYLDPSYDYEKVYLFIKDHSFLQNL